jgi:hypothetical protein
MPYDARDIFNAIERLAAVSPALAARLVDTLGDEWEAICDPSTFGGAVLARQAAAIAAGALGYQSPE